MTNQEITNALAHLSEVTARLDNIYDENGGEVTAETETMEGDIDALQTLLTTEGVDSLGRWLKAKQDEIATAKAEAAVAAARVKALQRGEEYIKSRILHVLSATGKTEVKGTYYTFAQSSSTTNAVNTDAIEAAWLPVIDKALAKKNLPAWLHVQLKTTATELKEAGESAASFLDTRTSAAVKFTKPRIRKED